MYSTYDFYKENGGSMTETEFKTAATEADSFINYCTFQRAKNAPEEMTENLKLCECAVADIFHNAKRIPLGISSEGNDGVNVSYSQNAQKEVENKAYSICRRYLTAPVNLMYAGR